MKKRYIKYFIFSVLFFSIISTVYFIAVVENPGFNIYDLGVNLLSEFAGMIFTVLVFNEFITYRQQLTNTRKFRMLYIELEELMKSIDFPFRTAAGKCIDNFTGDLWNKEVINTIRNQIMLSEPNDCVYPVVPWYMIFSMQGEKMMRKCNNISNQYQDILEPQISDYLFYLSNVSEMVTDLTYIRKIYESDLLLNYSRAKNLGSYFACPTDRDFEVIQALNAWIADKMQSEKQTKEYNIIMIVLTAAFAIGAIGYFIIERYFFGGLFAATAVLLGVTYTISYYKKKQTDRKNNHV